MNLIRLLRDHIKRKRNGISMLEVLFATAMVVMLTGTVYQVMRQLGKTFQHSRHRLDILQTTRLIMSRLRNDLRNALDKPQVVNGRLNIPVAPGRVVQYYFDENRRLYIGEKAGMSEGDPDVSQMRPFLFDDGQILKFDFDSSYRDSESFVESELALNAKVWFRVTMTILYTAKMDKLTEQDRTKLIENPGDDPRVKTFSMTITPRRVNWVLQSTQ